MSIQTVNNKRQRPPNQGDSPHQDASVGRNFTHLGQKDPIWGILTIGFLPLLILIFYKLTYSPIYVPLEIQIPECEGRWSRPERVVAIPGGGQPLLNRYYIYHRELAPCTVSQYDLPQVMKEIDKWAFNNGWQPIEGLKTSFCAQYAISDILLDQRVSEWLTYKPLGWNSAEVWTTTLCIGAYQDDECSIFVMETVSFSFLTEIAGRLR